MSASRFSRAKSLLFGLVALGIAAVDLSGHFGLAAETAGAALVLALVWPRLSTSGRKGFVIAGSICALIAVVFYGTSAFASKPFEGHYTTMDSTCRGVLLGGGQRQTVEEDVTTANLAPRRITSAQDPALAVVGNGLCAPEARRRRARLLVASVAAVLVLWVAWLAADAPEQALRRSRALWTATATGVGALAILVALTGVNRSAQTRIKCEQNGLYRQGATLGEDELCFTSSVATIPPSSATPAPR